MQIFAGFIVGALFGALVATLSAPAHGQTANFYLERPSWESEYKFHEREQERRQEAREREWQHELDRRHEAEQQGLRDLDALNSTEGTSDWLIRQWGQ